MTDSPRGLRHDPTQHLDLRRFPVATIPRPRPQFYAEVFGWEVEGRPDRRVPPHRARRALPARRRHAVARSATCTWASTTSANARPHPDPAGVEPRRLGTATVARRACGSSSATTTARTRILDTAEQARRHRAVAQPLLGRVQRLQQRVPRSVGQHLRPVDQGRRRSRRSRRDAPVSDVADTVRRLHPPSMRWTHIALPVHRHRQDDRLVRARSRRSSCSIVARTPTATAPGSAIPTRATSRSSSCWSASSATRTRARSRSWRRSPTSASRCTSQRRGRRHRRARRGRGLPGLAADRDAADRSATSAR